MSNQPLSSYNPFHQLQQDICDVVNAADMLREAGVKLIAENRLDIDFQIQESLQKQGIAAIVMTPDATYLGHQGTSQAWQLDDITVQVVEYLPISRAGNRQSVVTGLDLCNFISEMLCGPSSVIGFGKLCSDGIEQGEDDGLLVTKLHMKAYLENGTGGVIFIEFATKYELSTAITSLSTEIYGDLSSKADLSDINDGKLTFLDMSGQEIGYFTANQANDISVTLAGGSGGGEWGTIAGTLSDQVDLWENLSDKDVELSTLDDRLGIIDNTLNEQDQRLSSVEGSYDLLVNRVSQDEDTLQEVVEKVPDEATSENQLADKAFVNSSINNYAAFYITKNANGDAWATYAELSNATTFYNAGLPILPTKNDYCVVLEDETKTTALSVNPTTRYTWQGEKYPDGQWEFQYIVNNTSLTQQQVNAINSGITKEMVDNRVIPSTDNPGYAANADWAWECEDARTALTASYANNTSKALSANEATHALSADWATNALSATDAYSAEVANWAERADNANNATLADIAVKAQRPQDSTHTSIKSWQQMFNVYVPPFLSGYATEDWVNDQGFLTAHQSLAGYATEVWVNGQGFLKQSDLAGYATEAYVNSMLSDYTPLSTFNETLGDLSTLIHNI